MPKICIFNGDMSRGGGTEHIAQILANALVATGDYEISILNLNNEKETSYYPLDDRVAFHILKGKSIPVKIFELARFLRREKVDILIDVDIMLGIYALPATFFCRNVKLISWEMFNLRNDIGSKHTKMIRKLCLRRSAYYVNQTKGDMEAFIKEMPVKCPITYIYNPCEVDESYQEYDNESKTITTAGHFFYTKGYDLAVEVAKQVFARHPDWTWEFYGDGVDMEECRQKVFDYGLQNNVIFCGRTTNISAAYKKSAMYVMTSRTEGFGLVLIEAKSCNLPTLAFDIDFGPREIIEDRVSGYLVKPFEITEMANRICDLIEDPEKRKTFSERAKDNCGKFSVQEFVKNWEQILHKII